MGEERLPDKIPKSTSDVHLLASLPLLPIPIKAEPPRNVLDAFGSAVAVQVAEILGLPLSDPNDLIKGSDPKQLAQKIQDEIQPAKAEGSLVKFEMDSQTLCRTVSHQVNELPHLSAKEIGGGCGINSSGINPSTGKKKKFALEFSSPNIAKRIMQVILEVLS
ncbi:hypothetical protein H4Q26_002049 [Puccinia striiformis f. sp. tritici PST-130]|nr:hypothetical protein H4Q26_002049 [Puccinia striiformis f. sp. tritici PST-130]